MAEDEVATIEKNLQTQKLSLDQQIAVLNETIKSNNNTNKKAPHLKQQLNNLKQQRNNVIDAIQNIALRRGFTNEEENRQIEDALKLGNEAIEREREKQRNIADHQKAEYEDIPYTSLAIGAVGVGVAIVVSFLVIRFVTRNR